MSGEQTKERELRIWNDLLEHEARRENSPDHWAGELAGHASALERLGVIRSDELRELQEEADAAYSHVIEQLGDHERKDIKEG